MNSLSILVIILISLFLISICDEAATVSNITLSATAAGGLVVTSTYEKNKATVVDTIKINLQSLVERDANGTAITQAKHSFSDFSQFNITITPFINSTSKTNVSLLYFNLTITNPAETTNNFEVEVKAVIFTEEGEIHTGEKEDRKVGPGYVKFEFEVKNWVFCPNSTLNPCEGNQIGSFLDLSYAVQGAENATKSNDLKYKFGLRINFD